MVDLFLTRPTDRTVAVDAWGDKGFTGFAATIAMRWNALATSIPA